MTYGDLMLMFLGAQPIPEDLDPRIRKLSMNDCLEHSPYDEIIFDENTVCRFCSDESPEAE